MKYSAKPIFLVAHGIIWLSLTATAFGQDPAPKPMVESAASPDAKLTDEQLIKQLQLRLADDTSELDPATKTKVQELYKQAIGEMDAVKRWTDVATRNEKLRAEAPSELGRTKGELALPLQLSAVPADASLPQIEQEISTREADLEKLRKERDDDENAIKTGTSRRAKLAEQVSEAKERLAKITEQLQTPSGSGESPAIARARRMVLVVQKRSTERELFCREKELQPCAALTELLPLRRDLKARQVAAREQELKQWQDLANRRRQLEAEQQMQQAAWEAAGQAHPEIHRLLKDNATLAATRKELVERIADATGQLDRVTQQLTTTTEDFKGLQEKVKTVGLSNTIGKLLRKQREQLPNLREYRRNVSVRQQTMDEGLLALLELNDRRSELGDLDAQTNNVLLTLSVVPQSGNRLELQTAVREALNTRKVYLQSLFDDNKALYETLCKLKKAEEDLISKTEDCARFIDERVLWIASTTPLGSVDVGCAGDALYWLAGPRAWLDVGGTLAADAVRNPAMSILTLGLFVVLIYWRWRFRARVQEIGEKAARGSCYHFLPTLEAWVLTTLIAVGWPGLMYYLGWRLSAAADASELCKAIGAGLLVTARVYLVLELLRSTCITQGLGEAHFGWPASALKLVRQNVRWLSLPMLPLVCVAVAMTAHANSHVENDLLKTWDASLGRMCFVVALACYTMFMQRMLRPTGGVFQAMVAGRRGGWLERLRYVWYPLGVLTPATLAILAAAGYYYTAQQLAARLVVTMYVLVGVVVIRAVLLRWTLVNQRKLAIEQARQRRAAAQSEHASGEDGVGPDLPASATPDRDLATINIQTRRLVEYSLGVACALALWFAWIGVLPALSMLNRPIPFLNTDSAGESSAATDSSSKLPAAQISAAPTATGSTPGATDAAAKPQVQERRGVVTLGDLGLAILVLATTVIAAKNIPGLLEMAVLQHLPFDAGARYAVATVCRYLITLVGILICCGTLGVGWSKVQWLVAAMSLGLGFGLQEIFANFVSGLIILFERPVRVGDVVTIDGVTGVVSRIRMRATTVTDGDRKELVIPNKEFITGQVLNWTLTDQINRVAINVGVAYGSDTQRAAEILLRLAQEHPHVLDDPPPRVMLESFGDSALNFVLRCFLPNMENRGTVIHELHMAIDREFRGAGVEIAFPQHDVHVRSIELPLPVLQSAAGDSAASRPSSQKAA